MRIAVVITLFAVLAAAVLLSAPASASTPPTPSPTPSLGFIWGDLTCDRLVTVDDAGVGLAALGGVLEGIPASICEANGDVDCNGQFDGVDILVIMLYLAELPASPPGCPTIGDTNFPVSNECADLDPPVAIPDAGSATLEFDFTESREILGFAICINIDHPLVGDLILTLEHVDTGTTVTITDRVGRPAHTGNCTGHGKGLRIVASDTAAETLQTHCTDPAASEFEGGFKSEDLLSSFVGEDIHGHWVLTIEDAQSGFEGTALGSFITYVYELEQ